MTSVKKNILASPTQLPRAATSPLPTGSPSPAPRFHSLTPRSQNPGPTPSAPAPGRCVP